MKRFLTVDCLDAMRALAARALLVVGIVMHNPCAAVWLADDHTLRQTDPFTGQTMAALPVPRIAALAGTHDGGVWALSERELLLAGANDRLPLHIDIAAVGYGDGVLLAIDPFDSSAWVATSQRLLLHYATTGTLLGGYTLQGDAIAIGVGLDQTVWVAGESTLWNYSRAGTLMSTLPFAAEWREPVTAIAVDSLRARVWLTGRTIAGTIASDEPARTWRVTDVGRTVRDSALDTIRGVFWISTAAGLVELTDAADRTILKTLHQPASDAADSLAFDASTGILFIGSRHALTALDDDGGDVGDAVSVDAFHRLAGSPLHLVPRLSIVRPPESATIGDTRPTIDLRLEALCNGMPCDVGSDYLESSSVSATLAGEAISETFRIERLAGGVAAVAPGELAVGENAFTAQAIDRFGHASARIATAWTVLDPVRLLTATKAPNKSPLVALTSPANGARFVPGTNITLTATASDSDGTVAKVDFYRDGATLIGSDPSSPYSVVWTNVPAGTYSLTAKATDNKGATAVSTAASIVVAPPANIPPSVLITSPAEGAAFPMPVAFTITAVAADSDGTIASVDFYDGATRLGSVGGGTASVSASWPVSGLAPGDHMLKAVAIDNAGAVASATVTVRVIAAPLVVLTLPPTCLRLEAPVDVTLKADALAPDGRITQVAFYQGSTLIGVAASEPYTVAWNGVAAGTHVLTAKATDDHGMTTTSASVTLDVTPPNSPPTVVLTAPANGASYAAPATIGLAASASDPDGAIASVQFFAGLTPIGSATAPPYAVTWSNVPAGNYALTARAVDNYGAATTSAPVAVTVRTNAPPSVTLTAPSAGATYTAPATVNMSASANDLDGTVAKVDFYQGSTLIGTAVAPPYTTSWNSAPTGAYTLTAKATDNLGATAVSAPVNITVAANAAPAIALSSPPAGSTYFTPATIVLAASASDSDGVVRVDFYQGSTLIATASTAPYTFVWDNVSPGTYVVTAVATDRFGTTATSAPASITVTPAITVSTAPGIDGSTVNDDVVLFRGTLFAPANSGVSVNGLLAQVDVDGNFYVNRLPLIPGPNAVTISAITQDGQTATQTINVTSNGLAPFSVIASPTDGLAPLTVAYRIENRGGVTFQSVEMDFDNNGSVDDVIPAGAFSNGVYEIPLTYPAGKWSTVVTVKDANGNALFSSTTIVTALAPLQLETKLRSVFTGMLDRLRAGNINAALSAVTDAVYEKYGAIFGSLQPVLSSIVDQLGSLEDVTFDNDIAEYSLVRNTPDGPQRFMIYLIRGGDGIWRIEGM